MFIQEENDLKLRGMLTEISFLDNPVEIPNNGIFETYPVHMPDSEYGFLHEAAVIEYGGALYASWYNCPTLELKGRTPIRGRRSPDGGKTWSEIEVIADDESEKILYCPPVYGICDGKLYMFVNQMVAPDHIHSLDLYVLDNDTDRFVKLWSRPIPFKLNTNVAALPNGKLMLSGRVGELDGFPNTPAVMISDSGKIDAEWRMVKIAESGDLPDGERLVHPEISPIICGGKIYMLCRNDNRRVPLVYISNDNGESWSKAAALDIPIVNSKIYSGTLSDGRNFIIANIDAFDRTRLAMYISEKGTIRFDKYIILQNDTNEAFPNSKVWHYPVAHESDHKLYVIYTVNFANWDGARGAVISVVDINKI